MNSCEMNATGKDPLNSLGFQENFLRNMAVASLRGAATASLLLLVLLVTAPQSARAQTESVLYTFCSLPECADGTTPTPNLVMDAQGNLYGAAGGGSSSFFGGVVFELNLGGTETLLYNFAAINEGIGPNGGLVLDSAGSFYGTTAGGGYDKHPCKRLAGCGLVYKLTNGTEEVLYDFLGSMDGDEPNGSLVMDGHGNLYGTTFAGGGGNGIAKAGTIFEVSSTGTETVLHRFGADEKDGKFPNSGLVMDGKGNLYGTTTEGGDGGFYGPGVECTRSCGVVFEVNAAGVETVLYSFKGWRNKDGAAPVAGLILDGKGNFYGTTYAGGAYGMGTVFQITPAGKETVLYSFKGTPDGAYPVGRLAMDAQGNLYGSTSYGGHHNHGTVFELTSSKTEKRLYSFTGKADGGQPFDGLVMDPQGNLYGTTYVGGNFNSMCIAGCGVVFKVTP